MFTPTIRRMLGAGLALMLTGSLLAAHADTLPFTPTLTLGSVTLINDTVFNKGDGSFGISGEQQGGSFNGGAVWDMTWDLTVSQDPYIFGRVSVTNLTTTARNFNVTLAVPAAPGFSPALYGGSIVGQVTDANNDGSASMTPNAAVSPALYRGTIDGGTALSLFAINLACSGTVGCIAQAADSDGLPGLTLVGPGVTSSVGTLLNFSLSPGDRADFQTFFDVQPTAPEVPLPAALPLLLGGLGLLGFRRRR